MKNKLKINKKGIFILLGFIFFLLIVFIMGNWFYQNIHGIDKKLSITLNNEKHITLEVGSEYQEFGSKAFYDKKDISKSIIIKGRVDTTKIGTYQLKYNIKYKKIKKSIVRTVEVLDTTKPDITLIGEDVRLVVGGEYKEPGYSCSDNYDGDLTEKVVSTNHVDVNTIGDYEIVYTVSDSSGNEVSATRVVHVIAKPLKEQKVAVLNYHFFYDSAANEACNEGICEDVKDFREQLNYLRDNHYKTLTMKEFRDWMYGEIEIPEKSVLITVDDGALGTGKHNGNKLIPILEEYKMYATLFLVTGWWDISNYQSEYLDVESHTNDMHTEGLCSGVTRGAKMLCQSNEEVRNDLQKSISITNSKLAFCFPFYAYNDNAISLVKEAGFDLAFIGGSYKVSRKTDKYHIPRYPIMKTTSLQEFINYVS